MSALSTMYLCCSQPPEATWNMEPSRVSVVALRTMNGRKMSDENSVFRNKTGRTALPFSASFLKES